LPAPSDVDIGSTNILNHLLRVDEAVVENHLRCHTHILGQGLQTGSIVVPFTTQDVRMGSARDNIDNVLVLRQDLGQSTNHIFNPFVWGEQPECKQDRLAFDTEAVLIEVGIQKREIGNAMRNHVDLAAPDFVDFLQELGRQLAHDNEAIGKLSDLFHDHQLVGVGFPQNRVQGGHHGHLQTLQQLKNMAPGWTAEDPILVLQAHHIDVVEVQELSCVRIRREIVLGQ
jgi:hypothetical protein